MIHTTALFPGITLRCFPDTKFKQGCLSVQFVRPMDREEAALNALIPAVLLRGTVSAPDLRDITLRLDDLYGASVGALVRKVGDYQTTGLHCGFISDRFAMADDQILAPMIQFIGQLLLEPVLHRGVFREDYVESEKKNLISTIESQLNNKRAYTTARLLEKMCSLDPFGIPRLGDADKVRQIDASSAYSHYRRILKESPVEIFYVGAADPEQVAALLMPVFAGIERNYISLSAQTPFQDGGCGSHEEIMDISQGKLAMGFITPINIQDPRFAAMQVCNSIFGGGMTSKLFMNVREKMSLCYDIGSGYHGAKGIILVSAGIDCKMESTVRQEILSQLDACRRGDITDEELNAARQAVIFSLRGTHDSPGSIENYYASAALSGLGMTPAEYMDKVNRVDKQQVVEAANSLSLHTTYFLKGVQ